MSKVKRQHYVPQFILRNFSRTDDSKKIDLCNLSTGKIFRKQNIAEHCQKKFFYGEDQNAEKHLSNLEGAYSPLIKTIIKDEVIKSENVFDLNLFVSVQAGRTLGRKQITDDLGDALIKAELSEKLKEQNIPEEALELLRLTNANGSVENVGLGMLTSVSTLDLKPYLLVNRTDREFIISDDPVVRASLFLQTKFSNFDHPGNYVAGLQIYMPIGRGHALLFQDAQTYMASHKNGTVYLFDVNDIDRLNEAQVHNANNNIYFSDCFQDADIRAISTKRTGNIKRTNITRFEKGIGENSFKRTEKNRSQPLSEGCNEALIVSSTPGIPSRIRFSGMQIKPSPMFDHIENSLQPPVRDQMWISICDELMHEIEEANLEVGQSLDYIYRHPLFSRLKPVTRRQIRRLIPESFC